MGSIRLSVKENELISTIDISNEIHIVVSFFFDVPIINCPPKSCIIFRDIDRPNPSPLLDFLFDTIGISVFTLLGLQKGLSYELHPLVALIMGMISAVFGGVLRDVLTAKIPLIFEKEIYASACLSGGMMYLGLNYFKVDENINFLISAFVVITIRAVAVRFSLELPRINSDLFTISKK